MTAPLETRAAQEHVGRTWRQHDRLTPATVARLSALLDLDDNAPPPLGLHWLVGLPDTPQSQLGRDGHPRLGGELPDLGLPRRMWAGCRTDFLGPPAVDGEIEIVNTIGAIDEKQGSTGRLAIVRLERTFLSAGKPWVREGVNLVYLGDGPRREAQIPPVEPDRRLVEHTVTPDPTLLFRFAAVTFNAHRIHYDRDYAQQVEGYADLVVPGPLIAVLLMNLACHAPGCEVSRFTIRLKSPAFVNRPIRLAWTKGDGMMHGAAIDSAGRPHAAATAEVTVL